MVVGRLTKEMKKAELMEQLTEANEAYLEKISQHMECQYREMQRVEQRIERKKKLIDKKYIAFVLNLAIVIGLIGGYGSPRRALYTITDELMNSAYRFKRGWQFKNSLP